MSNYITIDGRRIGDQYPPYVIAEMSANHNGDINNAFKILEIAASAGVGAVKMQTYTADTLTLDCDLPDFQLTEGLWSGRSLYDLYEEAYTPWDWHKPLFERSKALGVTLFSSPFDSTAVDLLEDLNAPAYKIASFEAIDLPLIRYVASTQKPMIISTGMANLEEIQEAVDAAKEGGCGEVAILHCVSAYPAPADEYNLKTIIDMQNRFKLVTGLSDHTLDNLTAIASVALGASIIERHVTLNRLGGGPDDSFSLEPKELQALCKDVKAVSEIRGVVDYGKKSSESPNIKFRRSLYFVNDVQAGSVIKASDVRSIRPGYGAPPKVLQDVIGMVALKDLPRGTPVSLEQLAVHTSS